LPGTGPWGASHKWYRTLISRSLLRIIWCESLGLNFGIRSTHFLVIYPNPTSAEANRPTPFLPLLHELIHANLSLPSGQFPLSLRACLAFVPSLRVSMISSTSYTQPPQVPPPTCCNAAHKRVSSGRPMSGARSGCGVRD